MHLLEFDKKKQIFYFEKDLLHNLNYRSPVNNINFKTIANNFLFSKTSNKNYYIFKKFINPDIAIKIKDYYTKSKISNSFINQDNNDSFRLFYYLNSPFIYPKFVKSLIINIMTLKNMLLEHNDYYQTYCLINNINPNLHEEVAQNQILHSWQALFWYKNGCKFTKHIDSFGELACFLVLSKKGVDYDEGGIEIEYNDGEIRKLEDEYDYGDLVFLDQSSVYHQVREIKHSENQIGRFQFYIPTIPQFYMKDVLYFENNSHKPFFTKKISKFQSFSYKLRSYFEKNKIHHSRKYFNHYNQNFLSL